MTWRKIVKTNWPTSIILIAASLIISIGLEQIPFGFFCDEAIIGFIANQVAHGNFSNLITPLFYRHFEYAFGAGPIYATLPFVWIFGLNIFSIRFANVAWSIFTLVIIDRILAELKWQYRWLTVLLMATTPIFVHVARTGFGMPIGIFLNLSGLLLILRSRRRPVFALPAAILIIASAYGYAAFIPAALILSLIAMLMLIFSAEFAHQRWLRLTCFISGSLILGLPMLFGMWLIPEMSARYQQKTAELPSIWDSSRLGVIGQSYVKYWSPHYLFLRGEYGLPGSSLTRHNIDGHGLLPLISAPILLWAIYCLLWDMRVTRTKQVKIWESLGWLFAILLLYPIPHLLVIQPDQSPYPLASYPLLIPGIVFAIGYGFHRLSKLSEYWRHIIIVILLILTMIEARKLAYDYQKYPTYSADFWGWQWGAQPIMAYLIDHRHNYDQLIMTHAFNEPELMLQFFNRDNLCTNCRIGDLSNYDSSITQLFALRPDQLEEDKFIDLKAKFIIKHRLVYPNGKTAFVIGEIRP